MADNETKVTLTGEDKTGAMFKGASKNAAEYIKQLEKILQINESARKAMETSRRENHKTYTQQLETILKNNRAYNEANEAAKKGGKESEAAIRKQVSASQLLTRELASMAGGYLSVSAAISTATKAYTSFAAQQRVVSQLQNATGATSAAAKEVIKSIEEISAASGTHADKANEAFNNLRETMNLTNAQALKMLPSVITQAAGANSELTSFSKAFGDYMRNTKTPITDSNKAMEMLSHTAHAYGLNLEKAGPALAKLGEAGARWGYEGIKGQAKLNAMAAESSQVYGNSLKGANALINLLQEMGSDKVGQQMNKPVGVWAKELERVKKDGKYDVVGYMIAKTTQLMTVEQRRKTFNDETFQLIERYIEKNHGQMDKMINDIERAGEETKGLARGFQTLSDQQSSLDRLSTTFDGLLKSVGALLDKMGASDAMEIFTEDLTDYAHILEELSKGNFKVLLPDYTSHPGETNIFGGLSAAGKLRRAKERRALQEKLEAGMTPEQIRQFRSDQAAQKLRDSQPADAPAAAPAPANPNPSGLRIPIPGATYQPSSYQGGATYQPASLREDLQRGGAWVAGKVYNYQDQRRRNEPPPSGSGMGIRGDRGSTGGTYGSGTREGGPGVGIGGGVMPGGAQNVGYGGAADSKFLPANYRGGGGFQNASYVTGGVSGARDPSRLGPAYQPAGPGGVSPGSGYGGQSVIPSPQPGGGTVPRSADPGSDGTPNGNLAADRAKFKAEMDANPALRDKVMRIAANEQGKHGIGTQAVIESMMNRASMKGRTLAQEAKWTGEGGYYEQGNMGRGSLENPAHRKVLEGSLDKALAGSNVSDYATDNASQGLAAKRKRNQEMVPTIDAGGESFFRPGRVSGAGNVRKHAAWMERMQSGEARPAVAARPPAETSAAITGGGGDGTVTEAQGGIRDKPIDPQLKTAMEVAAEESNVKIRVTSGGQTSNRDPSMKGRKGGWTGSLRHNEGRAADIDILDPKTGKVLALDDPRRLKFLERSAAAGAGGTGTRYMTDPNKVHVGITGASGQVGKGLGAYAGTAEERAAVQRGLNEMKTPEQVAAVRKAQIAARKGKETPSAVVQATPEEAKVDREKTYEGSPLLKGRNKAPAAAEPSNQDEQTVRIKYQTDKSDAQFERANMRVHADRTFREARWNSWSDTGAA